MIGACDVCNKQDVEVSRCIAAGIETFACEECTECADEPVNEYVRDDGQFGVGT